MLPWISNAFGMPTLKLLLITHFPERSLKVLLFCKYAGEGISGEVSVDVSASVNGSRCG